MKTQAKPKSSSKSTRPAAESPKPHIPAAIRYEKGKSLRTRCAREAHAIWKTPAKRVNTIDLIRDSEKGRIPELLPLRHGRMMESPFTFYRAGAQIMAGDLVTTPNTGMRVQCCGDAHLSNFGGFATPERQIIFSINDLDETLQAPWEWDIKRLAASFVIASRNNGLSDEVARASAEEVTASYRTHMEEFSGMRQLELWYHSISSDYLLSKLKDSDVRKRVIKRLEKARESHIAEDIFPKLTDSKGERRFIKDQLPTIFHWEGHSPGEVHEAVQEAFLKYRDTLNPAHKLLLDRYELVDAAIKVVGVGSVGTRCWVLLLMAEDKDPLFLQVKQSGPSVLEPFAGKSPYNNHGERVVNGYRIMQPASDIFLGWTRGKLGNDFYFRQLRDMKIKVMVETFGKAEMIIFAEWCGHALALAHARSGDSAMLSGYMGKSDTFDKALGEFALAYADQNEKDYEVFRKAVKSGKLKAVFEQEKE